MKVRVAYQGRIRGLYYPGVVKAVHPQPHQVAPASLVVEGAGSVAVNGTYRRQLELENGKPVYTKIGWPAELLFAFSSRTSPKTRMRQNDNQNHSMFCSQMILPTRSNGPA